jgi:ribosomal protein S18 acetylase RimI-like enzyme
VIRRARPEDRADLYEICLRTGDAGADASHRYVDPDLLGHVYLGPYLALEPDLSFVVSDDTDPTGRPLGYCVGTADTARFERECAQRWWPELSGRYPLGAERPPDDQQLVGMIHDPAATDPALLSRFPGHLHIDLLPSVQGRGMGAALIGHMLDALAAVGCPGVHVGVATQNLRAVGFYERVGFAEVSRDEGSLILGRALGEVRASAPGPGTAPPGHR